MPVRMGTADDLDPGGDPETKNESENKGESESKCKCKCENQPSPSRSDLDDRQILLICLSGEEAFLGHL
jgi:hypothetical protein